jgi:hypothetical protein
MDVQLANSMLSSAPDWDVAGALQAGAGAAFIRRPRLMWSLPRPIPDVTGTDLTGIADQLIAG